LPVTLEAQDERRHHSGLLSRNHSFREYHQDVSVHDHGFHTKPIDIDVLLEKPFPLLVLHVGCDINLELVVFSSARKTCEDLPLVESGAGLRYLVPFWKFPGSFPFIILHIVLEAFKFFVSTYEVKFTLGQPRNSRTE